MKTNKILKVMCIIVAIIILIMVAFFGVYVKENGKLVDVVKDFTTASELGVEREYVFSVAPAEESEDIEEPATSEEEITENEEETENKDTAEDTVNTVENYKIAKNIMEKRIKAFGLEEYRLTLDEETGDIILKTSSLEQIDNIVYAIFGQGEFLLKDGETQDVLLNNDDIKDAKVAYNTETNGTSVYLIINLDKEGTKKLEDISSKYIKTTEKEDVTAEDGTVTQEDKEVTKNVNLYMDGELIVDTYFGETIKNGQLQLVMGDAVTTESELEPIILSGNAEAMKLSFGAIPLKYEATQSVNLISNLDENTMDTLIKIIISVITFILIYFVIRYKERGIMAGVLFVGFTALYLLVARYANATITYASIAGIVFIELFYICFTDRILRRLKKYDVSVETPKSILNKNILKAILVLIPALIFSVVFALVLPLGMSSFGIAVFWGIILFMIYSYLCIKTLLLNFEYLLEE